MLGRQIRIAELPVSSRIEPPKLVSRTFADNGWAGLGLFDDDLSLILTIPGLIVVRDERRESMRGQDEQ